MNHNLPIAFTALALGTTLVCGMLFLSARWLAYRFLRNPRSYSNLGFRQILTAVAVVFVMLPLVWFMEAGQVWARIVFGLLVLLSFSSLIVRRLRRHEAQDESDA